MPGPIIKPELLRWARRRLGRRVEDFGKRFAKLAEWERGESQPTLKQLDAYAKANYAPLVFINGADVKSAQMFTLAHELAHIWLGREGVSGFSGVFPGGKDVEVFCDHAAAEFLVPARELIAHWRDAKLKPRPFEKLARQFKVSPIVVGRRAMDLRLVDREAFFSFYHEYISRERKRSKMMGGGDFYNNQKARVGEMFAKQVIRAAKDGRLSFSEAYDLTGLRGGAFQELAHRLGFDLPL